MSKRDLPAAPRLSVRMPMSFDPSPQALERWNPSVQAAADKDADNTISIFGEIGENWFTGEGVTAKRVAAALRSIGAEKDVVVNVNSPGGNFFEGLAIYNLLREHKGDVTVKVLGLAASAASFIAMAGDRVEIARAGFLMIHNTWIVAVGDRNDLRAAADMIEPFDEAMADIYAARSGKDAKEIARMMDKETFISGSQAVDQGFADTLLGADEIDEAEPSAAHHAVVALHRLDVVLAKAGTPRAQRRKMIQELRDTQNAVAPGTPSAAADPAVSQETLAALQRNVAAFGRF